MSTKEPIRIIVVVRGGAVAGVCSSDPNVDVAILDYDNLESLEDECHPRNRDEIEEYQDLSDEADLLHAVY